VGVVYTVITTRSILIRHVAVDHVVVCTCTSTTVQNPS